MLAGTARVTGDYFPGYVGTVGTGKKSHHVGDVASGCLMPQRTIQAAALFDSVGQDIPAIGIDVAGRAGIDPDALRSEVKCQRTNQ